MCNDEWRVNGSIVPYLFAVCLSKKLLFIRTVVLVDVRSAMLQCVNVEVCGV